MLASIFPKLAEMPANSSESGSNISESREACTEKNTEILQPKIERQYESKELMKGEGTRPNIEVIKIESLQQIIEENKGKFLRVREVIATESAKTFESGEEPNEGEDVLENDEAADDEELSEEEINEKQKAAIKDALERIRNGEKLTNEELGNLGEMMMDQYYISQGYKPLNKHRVTSLDDKKGGFKTGIDGVYEKTNPDGSKSYVIADAKYNTSQLSETQDGKQMSDNWIDKRLDDAVGKEKADEIRDAAEDNPDSVKHEVYHIDPNIDENGNMHADTQEVDSEGNKTGEKTIVEYFDEDGNRIEPSEGGTQNEG